MTWYQRARDDGDPRAEDKCAGSLLRLRSLHFDAGTPKACPWDDGTPGVFISYKHSRESPVNELVRELRALWADPADGLPPTTAASNLWLPDNLSRHAALLLIACHDWMAAPVPLHKPAPRLARSRP
jgi:hypothetical protein